MSYSYTYKTFNTSRHIQDIYTQDIIDKSSHTRYIHTRHKLGKIDYPLTSSNTSMSSVLCINALTWNEIFYCDHPSCAAVKAYALENGCAGCPTDSHLLCIPQTLKCDRPSHETCGSGENSGKCICTGGVLRAVEAKMATDDWKIHAKPREHHAHDQKRKKWLSYNTSTTKGQYEMMSDRLTAIQKVAQNFTDECVCIENPFHIRAVECIACPSPPDPKLAALRATYHAFKMGLISQETLQSTMMTLYFEDNIMSGSPPTLATLNSCPNKG